MKTNRKPYTFEELRDKALQYNTVTELRKNDIKIYDVASKKGILKEICAHMPEPSNARKSQEKLRQEALKYSTRSEFQEKTPNDYATACKRKILDQICSHMPKNALIGCVPANKRWTREALIQESLKYDSRYGLKKHNPSAFNAAKKMGILEELYPQKQKFRNVPYSAEEIVAEIGKYKTRSEVKAKNPYLYRKILKNEAIQNLLPKAVHLTGQNIHNFKWTPEKLKEEASKYTTRAGLKNNNPRAYGAACDKEILDQICQHMGSKINDPWTNKEIIELANGYNKRSEFSKHEKNAYSAAHRMKISDITFAHMKRAANTSHSEDAIFNLIKSKYPKTQKLRDRKAAIEGKPHIKGFEVDIYIPELRKGIEFDGDYWHSIQGLKRSREHWPKEDLENYHQIKDEYFKSKGIELLHIKEQDWLNNQEICIDKIMGFLK